MTVQSIRGKPNVGQLSFKKRSRAPLQFCVLPRASFFFLFRLLTIRLRFVLLPSCRLPNSAISLWNNLGFRMFHSQEIWRFSCIRLAMSAKCTET